MADSESTPSESSFIENIFTEITGSFINLTLVVFIIALIYKIVKNEFSKPPVVPEEQPLQKIRKDFTVEELRAFDGHGQDGRILIAVNGKVFDVTRGKRFYGPGGPYAAFGGRDASRGLATFSVTCTKDGFDDLSDLNPSEMESVREWEIQFLEKYDYVGKLLKPGEEPTNYSDEEEEEATGADPASGDKSADKEKSKKNE